MYKLQLALAVISYTANNFNFLPNNNDFKIHKSNNSVSYYTCGRPIANPKSMNISLQYREYLITYFRMSCTYIFRF